MNYINYNLGDYETLYNFLPSIQKMFLVLTNLIIKSAYIHPYTLNYILFHCKLLKISLLHSKCNYFTLKIIEFLLNNS